MLIIYYQTFFYFDDRARILMIVRMCVCVYIPINNACLGGLEFQFGLGSRCSEFQEI